MTNDLDKLKVKLSELFDKLAEARAKDTQKFARTGWGTARNMRVGSADTHEKKVRERIDTVERQIA